MNNYHFCATIGSDGSVTIWNVELALFPVHFSNFKSEPKKKLKEDSEIESLGTGELFLGGLNIYDEVFAVDELDKK